MGEGGVGGVEFDVGAGDGAVLRVVDDSVNLGEDGGVGCWAAAEEKVQEKKEGELAHGAPRQTSDGFRIFA